MSSKIKYVFIGFAALLVLNVSTVLFYYVMPSDDAAQMEGESVSKQEGSSATEAGSESAEGESAEVVEESDEEGADEGLGADYYSVHFSYGDAVDLCMDEARSRNSNLVQLVVNEHSSRFNNTTEMYLVTLDSYVGTPMLYDEKKHTCEVDPKVQGVAFYKEIIRRKAVRPHE